jgi:hypothetical protein
VLVNSYGEPTVKCFNGNPLTGGAPLADAVTITPTNQVISSFQFTSVDNSSVVVVPGKPDPKPNKGPNPDPFLQAKADAAKQLAENARTEATTARADATKLAGAQKDAETKLGAAAQAFGQAQQKLASLNPFLQPLEFAQAQQALQLAASALSQAQTDLGKAKQAATDADTKAKNLEDKAKADEEAAAKATQEAEDSKNPHKKGKDEDKPVEVKKVDPTLVGPEGQTPITGQAGSSIPCGAVADSAVATNECKVPSGSADAATGTKPATGTTGGSTSTGSTSTGSGSGSSSVSGSSGSSSSSGSGSQSPAKGGTDK